MDGEEEGVLHIAPVLVVLQHATSQKRETVTLIHSWPTAGPTQPHLQWIRMLKWLRCYKGSEADCLPPLSAEVKKWNLPSTSPYSFIGRRGTTCVVLSRTQTNKKRLLSKQNASINGVWLQYMFMVRCGNIFANVVGRYLLPKFLKECMLHAHGNSESSLQKGLSIVSVFLLIVFA